MTNTGWGAWNASWAWTLVLVAATILVHAFGVVLIIRWLRWVRVGEPDEPRRFAHTMFGAMVVIALVACFLAVLHGLEGLMWAAVYVYLGALPNPADAILYSIDSMTTRGASGLTLQRHWLMMGANEAMDGMLLFGISTAFLFAVMIRIGGSAMLVRAADEAAKS